jgi:competence protein ComEA
MDDMTSIFQTRRRALLLLGACLALLLLAGQVVVRSRSATATRPPVAPLASAPAPVTQVVVDVVGAVRRPGLYRLHDGQRVADAVARAGGATSRADLEGINLASPLADGIQIVVPRRGAASAAPSAAPGAAIGPVHLNAATAEQLDALPGVGPVTAQKIVDYRQAHGAFRSVDDLDAIPGIGPARIDQLRDLAAP